LAWQIEVTRNAVKQLKRLDKTAQKRIFNFLSEKIEATDDPRNHGKSFKGKHGELWRYRVGDYRIICNIIDHKLTVVALTIVH